MSNFANGILTLHFNKHFWALWL